MFSNLEIFFVISVILKEEIPRLLIEKSGRIKIIKEEIYITPVLVADLNLIEIIILYLKFLWMFLINLFIRHHSNGKLE